MIPSWTPKWIEQILHWIYCQFDKRCCGLVNQKELEKEMMKNPEGQFYV